MNKLKKFKFDFLFKEDNILKKLFKNVAVLLVGDAGASILGVISLALTVRILGVEEYGWLVLIQTYTQTIDKLINFQSWQAFIKYGSEALYERDNTKIKSYIKLSFMLDISTAIIGMILAYFGAEIIGNILDWNETIINLAKIYSSCIVFNISGTPIGILRLFNKFKAFSINKILVAVIKLFSICIAYYFDISFMSFVIISLFIEIIGCLTLIFIAIYTVKKQGLADWWKVKINTWKEFLKFTIFSNLTSAFDIPVKQLDVFIINSVLSTEVVGAYKILKQITIIFTKLSDPIYQAIYPQLSRFCAEKDYLNAKKIVKKIGMIMFLAGLPIVIIASLTSKWWLVFLFGEEMSKYLVALIIFLLLKATSNIFVGLHPLFIALGYIKYNVLILLVSNVLYLISAWTLGIKLGIAGIIIAYGIQFSSGVIMKLIIINRNEEKRQLGGACI